MAGPASGLPTGSQCTTGFLSPSRGAPLCTDRLSQSLVSCSIAAPTWLSGMGTRKRLPFASRFASGKVVAYVVDLAATVEEEAALRIALFETGEASTAAVPATKPAATAAAAKMAAMTIHLGWCIATGRLLIRARLIGCSPWAFWLLNPSSPGEPLMLGLADRAQGTGEEHGHALEGRPIHLDARGNLTSRFWAFDH